MKKILLTFSQISMASGGLYLGNKVFNLGLETSKRQNETGNGLSVISTVVSGAAAMFAANAEKKRRKLNGEDTSAVMPDDANLQQIKRDVQNGNVGDLVVKAATFVQKRRQNAARADSKRMLEIANIRDPASNRKDEPVRRRNKIDEPDVSTLYDPPPTTIPKFGRYNNQSRDRIMDFHEPETAGRGKRGTVERSKGGSRTADLNDSPPPTRRGRNSESLQRQRNPGLGNPPRKLAILGRPERPGSSNKNLPKISTRTDIAIRRPVVTNNDQAVMH